MADEDDCEAICYLGMLLAFSPHLGNDFDLATTYSIKGANLYDPECLMLHGLLLAFKCALEGYSPNEIEWFEKAYARGSRLAAYQLGLAYYRGQGVAISTKKAFLFFEEAAKKGAADAAMYAGKCKAYGIGTTQCMDTALRWIRFAADNGDREAQFYLATIEEHLPNVKLSDEEKYNWLFESSRRGHPPALSLLGQRLVYGVRMDQSVERGIELLRLAASLSDADAQFSLGRIFELGEFAPPNRKFAIQCYLDAAENGCPHGHVHYGLALLNGNEVECDPELAEYHFAEAFNQGEPNGAIGLGYYHASQKDRVKALGYFNYAINFVSGHTAATVGNYKEGLMGDMSDAELIEAEEFARMVSIRGTA
jgi:TPR repeat protein